jgi:hypothetical protein
MSLFKAHLKMHINQAYQIAKVLVENPEGISINSNLEKPTTGYMVSVTAGPTYHSPSTINLIEIAQFIQENSAKDSYFGSWYDINTGRYYFDIYANLERLESATILAAALREIAIWDVENNCEIRLKY